MTTQAVAFGSPLDRAHFAQAADWLAVAVVISLPWSTSLSGILIALWFLAVIPVLDLRSLRWGVAVPAAAIPLALFAYAVIGMAWSGASLDEQWSSIKPALRLLAVPLLFVQFRHSERAMWVLGGFLASCTALLVVSWFLTVWPVYVRRPEWQPGVPVKDYIIQSSEFAICAFGLAHLSICAWRDRRKGVALALVLFALVFLFNIVFVATARSTLVVLVALTVLLAFQRFDWKGILAVFAAGVILAGLAWAFSPYLRARVLAVAQEIHDYQTKNAETSSGLRLEFWKKSVQFIVEAPVFGHGTGSIRNKFHSVAAAGGGASSAVTDQPHNQTFLVAIQLGLIGAALLFATWISHLLLFRGGGLAAWLGSGVVMQNFVMGLFNSYLFEFTLGWTYVFGVGLLGGMVFRQRGSKAAPSNSAVARDSEAR